MVWEDKGLRTQRVRTQVVVAVHAVKVAPVEGRVAGHVLRLLLLLVLVPAPAAAAEHLLEEAELRGCEGR